MAKRKDWHCMTNIEHDQDGIPATISDDYNPFVLRCNFMFKHGDYEYEELSQVDAIHF